MKPAEIVINSLGGTVKTAKALHLTPGAVSLWKRNGRVPSKLQAKILTIARHKGIHITADDIVNGRQ